MAENQPTNGTANKLLGYIVYALLGALFTIMTFLYVAKGDAIESQIKVLNEKKLDNLLYEKMQTQQQKYIGERLSTIDQNIKLIQQDIKALEQRR